VGRVDKAARLVDPTRGFLIPKGENARRHNLAEGAVTWRAALVGGAVSSIVLEVTPTLAGYSLSFVAGNAPVELFFMLAGILLTCYLVAPGVLLGAGVTIRVDSELAAGPASGCRLG
jgi:cell division protein FtsX